MKGEREGGRRSHSHMEDGLLVSNHLAVSHCQSVIASLQVKILKSQLNHLYNSGDIAKTTINNRCWNAPDIRCRGEIPSRLSLYIPPLIQASSINLFRTFVWHGSSLRLVYAFPPRLQDTYSSPIKSAGCRHLLWLSLWKTYNDL